MQSQSAASPNIFYLLAKVVELFCKISKKIKTYGVQIFPDIFAISAWTLFPAAIFQLCPGHSRRMGSPILLPSA